MIAIFYDFLTGKKVIDIEIDNHNEMKELCEFINSPLFIVEYWE